MALPIAPLGSMSSINLPNYVPNTVVPDRNPVNLALAAFLQGMASNAGSSLANNAFSRDFAAETGEAPASFGQKLMSGPKVSREQLAQTRGNDAVMARLDKEIGATNSRLDKTLGAQKAEFDTTSAQQDVRINQQYDALKQQKAEAERTGSQRDEQIAQGRAGLEQQKAEHATRQKEVDARLAQMIQEGQLTAERAKLISAELGKVGEETRMMRGQNDRMEKNFAAEEANRKKSNPLTGAKMPGAPKPAPSSRELTQGAAQEASGKSLRDLVTGTPQLEQNPGTVVPVAIPYGAPPVYSQNADPVAPVAQPPQAPQGPNPQSTVQGQMRGGAPVHPDLEYMLQLLSNAFGSTPPPVR